MAKWQNIFLVSRQTYCLKTWQEQKEDNSTDDICYLENIFSTEQLFIFKLADKQATEDELNIDEGKHVLACFQLN